MTPILLCLHGWGGSKESFTELRAALEGEDITIFTPDLPGFGAEPEPKEPWSVDDYADWVAQWLTKQSEIRNQKSEILLLGHSHGGRIAIKLASRQSTRNQKPETRNLRIDHLYLCAAAGIPRASLKRMMGFILAKMGKAASLIPLMKSFEPRARTLLYSLLREHDYERASPVMRRTLAKVVAEDLTPLLSAIHMPTDLFWGADDTMTPLRDGKLMHKHIAGSVLHIFEGVRHRVHRDRAMEIASVISSHL